MKCISVFLLLVASVLAEWQGCIQENQEDNKVTKGQSTPVCLNVAINAGNWADQTSYRTYSFTPYADDYSRFIIAGSFESLVQNNAGTAQNITVFGSSQQSVSFLRMYYQKNVGVFPYLTAVIDVKDGIVQGIAWDKACIFCSNDKCAENTYGFDGQPAFPMEPTKGCFIPAQECIAEGNVNNANTENPCDLKLHVVWTGTDANGKYLTSSSKRFSAFNPKQVRDQLKDAFDKLKDTVNVRKK